MNAEMIGMAAAALTTVSFAPQALHVIRTKDTAAISFTMYALFLVGLVLWEIYGIMINSTPVIISNILTIALSSVIFAYKARDVLAARARR